MNLFHKVVYKIIPVTMPDYLTLYSGDSRLRSTHLHNLSFVSNIASTTTSISNLNKSFFFRSHTLRNFLPFDLINSSIPSQFKLNLLSITGIWLRLTSNSLNMNGLSSPQM